MATKPKRKSRADLEREVAELHAQLIHVYHFASNDLPKANTDRMLGSGVVLRLHALGGREIIPAVLIRDGLSEDTIAALQRDLARSYDLAVVLKPKGAALCASTKS